MAFELITVIANGFGFRGWKDVTITAEHRAATRSFDLSVSEVGLLFGSVNAPPFRFPPNTLITILAGSTLVVTGAVDDYLPSASGGDMHNVVIRGRGLGRNYVDCSPIKNKSGQFENKTVLQICQALDEYGVGVKADKSATKEANEVIPYFRIRRGSTSWAEAMRLLQQRGLTMSGQSDGSILITKGGANRHGNPGLVQGVNVIEMSAMLSGKERFSDYVVIGQNSTGTEDDDYAIEESETDSGVPMYRPKEIVDTDETTRTTAKARAAWEKARAAGVSAKAEVTVKSWRDISGLLWEPGFLVFVSAPVLKIEQDMLIDRVIFAQSVQGGTVATLSLVSPETSGAAKPSSSGSGSEWSIL